MKKFELFRYIKKWLPLIIVFFIAMTILAYRMLEKKQKYIASSVIEYSNESASDGCAPDGSKIDVSEIYSSANMAKVMRSLGLSYDIYSLDTLCAGITVTPIIEEQEENIRNAVNEEGEEYTVQPTAYSISCTLDSSGNVELARNILNELLDVYFSDYSNKHINQEQINNQTRNLEYTDYDYLEMIITIKNQLAKTINVLQTRYERAPDFRSVNTGYSFADLKDQFSLLYDIDVSRLYSLILGNQITKDKNLLIDKYQNMIANYKLNSTKAQENIDDILSIIDSYVNKMRESGNTDINFEYILSDVYEHTWLADEEGNRNRTNRTVQYDTLLRSWIQSQNKWDNADIDIAYCEYIIGVYRDGITSLMREDSTKNLQENSEIIDPPSFIVSEVPKGNRRVSTDEVEVELKALLTKINKLYDVVTETNVEYNKYLGAQNIRILSSTSVRTAFNMKLYKIIIAAFFLIVGCCGAIILGRLGDILEYLFLKDNITGCMNRVSCDSYIQKYENLLLPLNMCCINLQIINQKELNNTYGRNGTDEVLKKFGRILQDVFGNRKSNFIAYNGGGQFFVFFEKTEQETIHQEAERLYIILTQSITEYSVSYQMGAVNAGEEALFWIRGLISNAVKDRKLYTIEKKPNIG